jgi:uncharacterized DUF497 family protein
MRASIIKAAANLAKHKVSFEEAATVFPDPLVECGAIGARYRHYAQNGDWLEFRRFCETSCLYPILPTGNLTRHYFRRTTLGGIVADPRHSSGEERFVLLGFSHVRRLLAIMYAERGGAIRIISARPATRSERRNYEEITQ